MIYVTSDLHGCSLEQLMNLLQRSGFSGEDFLFVLGDVIDRGEHGVALLRWMAEQPNVQLILGNHEAMLLSCDFLLEAVTEESLEKLDIARMELLQNWLANGAAPTLTGLRRLLKEEPEVLEGIMDLLRTAPLYEQIEAGGRKYILVHAGLGNFHPDRPLEDYTPDELLMARPLPDTRYFSDATVIFGHTPTGYLDPAYRGRAMKTDSWICIDTGAAMGGSPMLLRLEDRKEFY
jgi:serine/threonine protein phosphatase 1